MKGTYSKKAIGSVVDPLKAISNVFNNTAVHVVYEMEDETVHISTTNEKKSVYAMYELDAKEAIEGYEPATKEIGIWDVKQFVNILGKYDNDIYTEDVKIDCEDKKLVISCGDEITDYYLSQLHLFDGSRSAHRKLKTDSLTEAANFELTGVDLKKLLTNINVFEDQNEITIIGKEGEGVTVRLSSSQGTVSNKNELKFPNIEVKANFSQKFPKSDFKGLLVCNGTFQITVYTGKKDVVNAYYEKDNYKLNFYLSPLVD
jgi:hypothetical protein